MGNSKSQPDPNPIVGNTPNSDNLSLKGSSNGLNEIKKNGSNSTLNKPIINAPSEKQKKMKGAGSARSSMSSEGRGKPVVPLNHRQIIKYCMDNSKEDLGERIYRRVIEKRDDFRQFVESLPRAQRIEMSDGLRDFLLKIIENLTDNDEVQRIAEEFGERHVQFRSNGFRPDFFASTADAMTTECVFLDAAVHQATETLTAWSALTATMFSGVRDGYYAEMRRIRKASNFMSGKFKGSVELSIDSAGKSEEEQPSHRSTSPVIENSADEEASSNRGSKENVSTKTNETLKSSESSNFLCPPQVY
ncbi:hypothetical protein FO519_007599 [Halicephalobus sp. NKZ332]|nr:hypothetical protein FO519_007599 [Halicephalobus sp. NKZ332]